MKLSTQEIEERFNHILSQATLANNILKYTIYKVEKLCEGHNNWLEYIQPIISYEEVKRSYSIGLRNQIYFLKGKLLSALKHVHKMTDIMRIMSRDVENMGEEGVGYSFVHIQEWLSYTVLIGELKWKSLDDISLNF